MAGYRNILGALCLCYSVSVYAVSPIPVPTGPAYYEPPVEQAGQQQLEFNCYQLDAAINALHPYRYSHKPDFYADGTNQIATALIIFDKVWLGLGYLGYSALVTEKEKRRTLTVEEKIIVLQQLKAARYCYQ